MIDFSRDAGESTNENQQQQDSPGAQQASGAGGDIIQAGHDVNINKEAPARPELGRPWLLRPGAPQFRMRPGRDGIKKLLNTFDMKAPVPPANVEARWVGSGIDMDWMVPMRQNTPDQFQMKGVEMNPTPPQDSVTFEVRFWLEDGQHGGRWHWPVIQHEKGHWNIRADLGSGVDQPKLEDTWGP